MRLSLQLYTLRDPLANDLEGSLRAVRDMGLDYVELAGTYGLQATEFKQILDTVGLQVSAGHWGLDQVRKTAAVAEEANALGCRHVVLPWVPREAFADGWVTFGKELETIAERFSELDLTFGYHNHAFEFEPNEHSSFADMWAATSSTLKCQLDVGWVAVAGEDPVRWMKSLHGRLSLVHLKEYSGNPDSHDAEAGSGVLDWVAILDTCAELGVEYGAIEMDRTPDDPVKSVERCVKFFQSKGLR